MVDDYSGYKASFNAKKTVEPCIELGCWTHARRKFFDLHKANQSPMAKAALVRIGQLYAIEAELEQLAEQQPVVTAEKPKRPRAGRQPLPAHLPRIEFRHEPDSCQCGQCGSALNKIREDVTEQLDVVPAVFTVHRHIRPQ